MTHDKLLELLDAKSDSYEVHALRAVVELHKQEDVTLPDGQWEDICSECSGNGYYSLYPCPTIQAIEKELK